MLGPPCALPWEQSGANSSAGEKSAGGKSSGSKFSPSLEQVIQEATGM